MVFHPALPPIEINSLLIIGTLAGELPDIDLIRLYFDHKLERPGRVNDHRVYITHAPFFWLMISLIIVAGGYLAGSLFTEWIGWLVLAGSWSHLILDSLEYGVMWLWPFSKKLFTAKKEVPSENIAARPGSPSHHFHYISKVYVKTISFWVEIIITLAAAYLFFTSL